MYRTLNEIKYFGSDFNKFLNSLTKEMTVINIDCLQFKSSKNHLRIIESKHLLEKIPDSQLRILKILAQLLGYHNNGRTIEVCIVRADPPYNKIKVMNLTTKQDLTLEGDNVKKWCSFEDIGNNEFPEVPDTFPGI